MRLLREYIRDLLTEAAKGPQDLPDNWYVKFWDPEGTISVSIWKKLPDGRETQIAELWADETDIAQAPSNFPEHDLGPCSGAWQVVKAHAPHGWGPMLYDVAMEIVGSAGLTSDRGTVTQDAMGIWVYYDQRGDVQAFQLDNPSNELTPELQDNCMQNAAEHYVDEPEDWMKSPLSRRYVKSNTATIDALKELGKWAEEEPE